MLFKGLYYTLLDEDTMKIFETIFDRSTDKFDRPVIRTLSVKESDVPLVNVDPSIVETCIAQKVYAVETPMEPDNVLLFPLEEKRKK